MDALDDFEFKRRKYMPIFSRADGKPTVYIEGYPSEDDEPMAATGFHGEQINILSRQLKMHFSNDNPVYVGVDSFVYYDAGDISKFVGPDIYVVLGVLPFPERRSFYTWAEGTAPAVIFEFLSESTAAYDRGEKIKQYLVDIGVEEYFIHQPEADKPPEFRGWRRSPGSEIEEMTPDDQGRLFSHALNLWLRWQEIPDLKVRLLRPYLPDGTPIPTSEEWKEMSEGWKEMADDEKQRREQAEALLQEETQRSQQLEAELEKLRAQLITSQNETLT